MVTLSSIYDLELNFEESLQLVHESLLKSVKERFESIPEIAFKPESFKENKISESYIETNSEVAILFSGGIDSSLLTALVCEVWQNNEQEGIPIVSSIDLLTVCFGRTSSDLLTSIISYYQLSQQFPDTKINLIIIE